MACRLLPANKKLRDPLAATGITGDHLLVKRDGEPYSDTRLGHWPARLAWTWASPDTLRTGYGIWPAPRSRSPGLPSTTTGPFSGIREMAALDVQPATRITMAKNAMKKWEQATNESD